MKTRTHVALTRPREHKPAPPHRAQPPRPLAAGDARDPVARLLRLQRSVGNQAVTRLMREYEGPANPLQRAAPAAAGAGHAPAEPKAGEDDAAAKVALLRAQAFAEINGVISETKESFDKLFGDEESWHKVQAKIKRELRPEKRTIVDSHDPEQIRKATGQANIKVVEEVDRILTGPAGQAKSELVERRAQAFLEINGAIDDLGQNFTKVYGDDKVWAMVKHVLQKAIHPELQRIERAKNADEVAQAAQQVMSKLGEVQSEFESIGTSAGDDTEAVDSGPKKPADFLKDVGAALRKIFETL